MVRSRAVDLPSRSVGQTDSRRRDLRRRSTRIPALIPPRVARSLAIAYSLFITIAIWPSPSAR